MKTDQRKPDGLLTDILSIISVALVALLLVILFKVKAGIMGLVLGTIAVAALIYWLKEIKEIFREEKPYPQKEADWFYDLIEDGEGVTLIARVPGPAGKVKVTLDDKMLEIKGGGDLINRVPVPEGVRLQEKSYRNGVLRVKLQRIKTPINKMPRVEQEKASET